MLSLTRVAVRDARPLAAAVAGAAQPAHAPHHHLYSSHVRSASAPPTSRHQRRHSSSKPSNPPSDDTIAKQQATSATSRQQQASSTTAREQPATSPPARGKRVSRARTKERDVTKGQQVAASQGLQAQQLPSVPSTQHLDSSAVNLASFFSLHRPISVTAPVPSAANSSSFAAIFNPSRRNLTNVNDTLLTLTSAVRGFDKAITASSTEPHDLRAAVTQASASNAEEAEGTPDVVYISVQELAASLRPFHPPPPPLSPSQQPHAAPAPVPSTAAAAAIASLPRLRPRTAGVYAARMRARRRRWMAGAVERHAAMWHAISTRRQRKLRMKKHKFKKLVRRQKNEKRRQDRL